MSHEKRVCQFTKYDKIMIRLLQIVAVVAIIDITYVLWRCCH
jgi:cell division protein FtsL